MPKVNLASPWERYYRDINALFGDDPEITVTYDEGANEIKLLVENPTKADALALLLPTEKTFGTVTVTVSVVPANDQMSRAALFQKAFDGNPAFSYVEQTPGSFGVTYIVFAKKVVQYFSDNLGDLHGLTSTLYQDIADRVFDDQPGVFFCTDPDENAVEVILEG